jgi:hypothetical protein
VSAKKKKKMRGTEKRLRCCPHLRPRTVMMMMKRTIELFTQDRGSFHRPSLPHPLLLRYLQHHGEVTVVTIRMMAM